MKWRAHTFRCLTSQLYWFGVARYQMPHSNSTSQDLAVKRRSLGGAIFTGQTQVQWNIQNEVHLYWKWDTSLLHPSLHDTHRFSSIQIRTGRRKLPRNQISLSLWYYSFPPKEFYQWCHSCYRNWWCNLFPATYRLHMGECMSKKCCKKNTFSS